MASPPLFDLNGIDFSGVAISADDVGRMNPQSGHMRQLDHVIWINEQATRGLGVKQVRHDEFWIPGHIPGQPLMPGVLMIEAAAQLCSILFRSKLDDERFLGFTRCDNVVFRDQVKPGDTMHLLCEERQFKPRRFVSDAQAMINGTVVFEAKITGMVFRDM